MQKKQNASITFPVALGGMNNVLPADMIGQTQATLLENVIYDKYNGEFKGSEVLSIDNTLKENSNIKELYVLFNETKDDLIYTKQGKLIVNNTVLNISNNKTPKNVLISESTIFFTDKSKIYSISDVSSETVVNGVGTELESTTTYKNPSCITYFRYNDGLYVYVELGAGLGSKTSIYKGGMLLKTGEATINNIVVYTEKAFNTDNAIFQVVTQQGIQNYTIRYYSKTETGSSYYLAGYTSEYLCFYWDFNKKATPKPFIMRNDSCLFLTKISNGQYRLALKFLLNQINASNLKQFSLACTPNFIEFGTIKINNNNTDTILIWGVYDGKPTAIITDYGNGYNTLKTITLSSLPFKPFRAKAINGSWVFFGFDDNLIVYAYRYDYATNTFENVMPFYIKADVMNGNFDVDYFDGNVYIVAGTKLYTMRDVLLSYGEIRCLFIQNGRMVYSFASTLFYSSVGDFYNWETGTEADALFLEVGYKDGGVITHAVNLYGNIIVVKNNGYIYRVSGDYPNWVVTKLGETSTVTSNLFDYGGSIILGTETGLKIINTTQNYGDLTISDFQNNIVTGKVTHISESKERQSIIFCSDKYVFEYYIKLNCFTVYQKESYYQMEELETDTYALKDGKIYKSTTDLNPVTVQRALIHNQYNIVIKAITLYTDTLQDDTEIEIEFYKDKKVTRILKAGQNKHKFFITVRLKELQLKYKHNGSIFINNTIIELMNVGA